MENCNTLVTKTNLRKTKPKNSTQKTCHPKKEHICQAKKNSCLPMFPKKTSCFPGFLRKKPIIQMGWIQLFPPTESTPTVEPNWIRWGSWASQGFVGKVGLEAQLRPREGGDPTWENLRLGDLEVRCHLHMWKHRILGQWKKRWWKFGWWKWWWIFGILHDPWFPFLPNFPNFSETDSRPKQSSSCTCVFVMVGW